MTRTITAVLIAAVLAPAAWAEFSVFGAGGTQSDSKQKIVDKIQDDLGKVAERLNKADPGTETQRGMQRIIDNIEELLKQKNPNRDNASNPPPPKSNASQKPDPASNPSASPMTEPKPGQPSVQPKPGQPSAQPKPADIAKKPTGAGESTSDPKPGEKAKNDPYGRWGLRARALDGVDAFGREQLMDRYEELTRAYYRSLAESRRREP